MMKETRIWARCTPEQREQINRTARTYGMSTSQFILAFAEYVRQVRPALIIQPLRSPVDNQAEREYT